MPVYVHNTLALKPERAARFDEVWKEQRALLERRGWKLVVVHRVLIGPQHMILNIWELPDANSYSPSKDQLHNDLRYGNWDLGEVLDETDIQLMQPFAGHQL